MLSFMPVRKSITYMTDSLLDVFVEDTLVSEHERISMCGEALLFRDIIGDFAFSQ